MKKLFILLLFLCFPLTLHSGVIIHSLGVACEQATDTIILGNNTANSSSTKNTGDLVLSRFPALYTCSIDTIYVYPEQSWGAADKVTAGIYDDAGNLLGVTAEVTGTQSDGTEVAFTLGSPVALTASTYYILAFHVYGTINFKFASSQAAGLKAKTISSTHTYTGGSLPDPVNVTSMTDTYSFRIHGENP